MAETPRAPLTLQQQLGVFQARFLERLEDTLAGFEAQLSSPGAALSAEVVRQIHAQLHKLAGSGGTFGFPELSRQAHALEAQAQGWLQAGAGIPPSEQAAWIAGVLGLRQCVNSADSPQAGAPRSAERSP